MYNVESIRKKAAFWFLWSWIKSRGVVPGGGVMGLWERSAGKPLKFPKIQKGIPSKHKDKEYNKTNNPTLKGIINKIIIGLAA